MPMRRKSMTGNTKAISTAAAPRSRWRRRRPRGITDSGCTITGGPRISVPSRVSCDHFEESLDRRAEGSHTKDDHHRDEPDHDSVFYRGGLRGRHKREGCDDLSLIHISEPTRRTPISYAVFCLKKKN